MSRIKQTAPPPQKLSQPKAPTPQQQQHVGNKTAFAKRFTKSTQKQSVKPSSSKQETSGTQQKTSGIQQKTSGIQQKTSSVKADVRSLFGSGPKGATKSLESKGNALIQRQGSGVIGRSGKGALADLHAKLDGKTSTKSSVKEGGVGTLEISEGIETEGKLLGKEAKSSLKSQLGKEEKVSDLSAFQTGNPAMNKPPTISQAPVAIQVQGGKISTAMADKIIEHTRFGVTETGAAQFQFETKGDVLGGMKMEISFENGQIKAIFMSENPEIRQLMDRNLKDLQRQLEDKGLMIAELEIRDPADKKRDQQNQQNQKEREEAIMTE